MASSKVNYYLLRASTKGDLSTVKLCLDKGADVNARSSVDQQSSLHYAVEAGHVEVIKILLEHHASVNAVGLFMNTPLHISCIEDNPEATELLLQHGASVSAKNTDGSTPLHLVSSEEVAVLLLEHGASINTQDSDGQSPLHIHISNPDLTILLLTKKPLIELKDVDGQTPLHLLMCDDSEASIQTKITVLEWFDEQNVNLNIQGKGGFSLLHCVLLNPVIELVNLLLRMGVKVDVRDDAGRTPLRLAEERKCWQSFYLIYGHILKLNLVGIEVDEDIESFDMAPKARENIAYFKKQCELELNKMKYDVFYDNFSLFNIISQSPKPFPYVTEQMVYHLYELILSSDISNEYPIYESNVNIMYRKLVNERFYLLQLASQSLLKSVRKSHWNNLPTVPQDIIFKYLSNEDLKNFIYSSTSHTNFLHFIL